MEKQQLINELREAVLSGNLSKNEVIEALSIDNIGTNSIVKRLNLSEVFYYIGGIIVLIGLIILVGQNWDSFNYVTKVSATFGMGLAFFISAIALLKTESLKKLGTVFFFISAVLVPFGYFIMFWDKINSSNIDFYNSLVPFLCLLQFGIAQFALKKDIFTFFNTIFATWLFFGFTNNLISENSSNFNQNFHLYRVILVGISYASIGYYLKLKGRLFSGLLNTLGVACVLGAGFVLNVMAASSGTYGGPEASFIWVLLYPIMIVGAILSSVWLKNSALLFIGTLSLIGYIIRVMSQHFADTMGGALLLIVIGGVVMGLGYLAFHLNKKYIKNI